MKVDVTPRKITPALSGIELIASLEGVVNAYREDPSNVPVEQKFNATLFGIESRFLTPQKLAEILVVVDQWSKEEFWMRRDIVQKRIEAGAFYGFVDEKGNVFKKDDATEGDTREYSLISDHYPGVQYKEIKELILSERPQALFFLGENIAKGVMTEESLNILLECSTRSDTLPNAANAARRVLATLVLTGDLTNEALPDEVRGMIENIVARVFSINASGGKNEPSSWPVKNLLMLHSSQVEDSLLKDIASSNDQLTEAYTILRQRLQDPETSIDERVQLFDKYIALNQALASLLPKKTDKDLEKDLMFIFSNSDMVLELSHESGYMNVVGGFHMAKAVRHQLGSPYFHEEAAKFLVLAGALDYTAMNVELMEAMLEKELGIDEACNIAQAYLGERVAKGLRARFESVQNGSSKDILTDVNLFQLTSLKQGKLEKIPIKLFQPDDKIIVDDSIAFVLGILSLESTELAEKFTTASAKLNEPLRKYIGAVDDARIRRWAKQVFRIDYKEELPIEIYKKAWCIHQIVNKGLLSASHLDKPTKKSILDWFTMVSGFDASKDKEARTGIDFQKRFASLFLPVLLTKDKNEFQKLCLSNLKQLTDRYRLRPDDDDDGSHVFKALAYALYRDTINNNTLEPYYEQLKYSELKFPISSFQIAYPSAIHSTINGAIVETHFSNAPTDFRYLFNQKIGEKVDRTLTNYEGTIIKFLPDKLDPNSRFIKVEVDLKRSLSNPFVATIALLDLKTHALIKVRDEPLTSNIKVTTSSNGEKSFISGTLNGDLVIIDPDTMECVFKGKALGHEIHLNRDGSLAYARIMEQPGEFRLFNLKTKNFWGLTGGYGGYTNVLDVRFLGEFEELPFVTVQNLSKFIKPIDEIATFDLRTSRPLRMPDVNISDGFPVKSLITNRSGIAAQFPPSKKYYGLSFFVYNEVSLKTVLDINRAGFYQYLNPKNENKRNEHFFPRGDIFGSPNGKFTYVYEESPYSSKFSLTKITEEGPEVLCEPTNQGLKKYGDSLLIGAGDPETPMLILDINREDPIYPVKFNQVSGAFQNLLERHVYVYGKLDTDRIGPKKIFSIPFNQDTSEISVSDEFILPDNVTLRSVWPVPGTSEYYALVEKSSFLEKGIRDHKYFLLQKTEDGKIKWLHCGGYDKREARRYFGLFSPDGKERFAIVRIGDSYKIFDLNTMQEKVFSKEKIVDIDVPHLAPDGSYCFLKLHTNRDGKNGKAKDTKTVVLWWNEKGVSGHSPDNIRDACWIRVNARVRSKEVREVGNNYFEHFPPSRYNQIKLY